VTAPHVLHLDTSSASKLAGDIAAVHRIGTGKTGHGYRTVKVPLRVASPAGQAGKSKTPGTIPAASPHRKPAARSRIRSRTRTRAQTPAPVRTLSATRTPDPTPTPAPTPAGPVCDGTAGLLPANFPAIVTFLMSHGYTGLAAAGIAGNIYQESKGNPESVGTGGGGLIGWTPLPAGLVTGNPAADLQTQLNALLTYNQQWAAYIPALNAATSATQAAYIYMTDFERPGIPAAYNRETAAADVAAACHL
jgi:hypothetical protein